MNVKVIIAEDERLAREELIYLLSREEGIELLATVTNGRELLEAVQEQRPDVVFLDIQMPEMDGLETSRRLLAEKEPPYIVFTTAYDQYAVEAFNLNAVDYLLKPYDDERLRETIQRIREKKRTFKEMAPKASDMKEPVIGGTVHAIKLNRLLVDDGNKMVVIQPDQILFAEKQEKETIIYTADGKSHSSKFTLQELEQKLAGHSFFRSHRSYLVNLDYILEIEPWFSGAYNVLLKEGKKTKIPVSRASAKELLKILKGELS
jgi:two-component system response regulator LytT